MSDRTEALEAERAELANKLEFYANNEKGCLYSQRKTLNEAASALRRLAAAGEQKPVAFLHETQWGDKSLSFEPAKNHLQWKDTPLYPSASPSPGWEEATGYAERLAVALWEKHYKTEAQQWEPMSGDLIGILTQISNMTCGLSRSSQSTSDAVVAGPTCRCHDDTSRKYCLDKDRCTPIPAAQSTSDAGGEGIKWRKVNDDQFEYAIQRGQHGDEFVKMLNGSCLRRPLSNPAAAEAGVRCANCKDPLTVSDAPLFCGCCREMGANPAAVEQDCEVCGDDCSSANPPVIYCPVNERKQREECCDLAAKEPCEDCPFPNPAAADSNASAEARLREALEHARARFECLAEDFAAKGDNVDRSMCEVDVEKMTEALSPDPHASDCDKQGEIEIGPFQGEMKNPSDRTADVTVEELRAFLLKNVTMPTSEMARALLDAFTVGRR